ncbi:2-phospho-L-lactate guanylyltransferase [Leisingera methylohalidivorans]|uniref:2-phospho-L-lactate guanylyltransferase n=1 Tax=Leisingera methylohalidivorans DSM 14336 TaxID=999552 RepID=V9VPV7_9RHOB|nr:2-phospho-L-lactate guanylyltransferase [Leisingera methylohalidivorans]AHD00058.1 2-phospho-L-lactate guanylyltransferase [Leisingera methylohalidivorans DSM 14336]
MSAAIHTGKRLVVIPMKDPSRAKTRLDPTLSPERRATLALTLFRANVTRLQEALALLPGAGVEIAVVTSSQKISRLAQAMGLLLIDEGCPSGLSDALETAACWAAERGYTAICVLPGDLAAPKPAELARLLSHDLAGGKMVLCPADDLGTNALLAPLPCPFRFAYGVKSVVAHRQAAEAAGLCPVMLPLASLRADVDTADDLQHLLAHQPQLLMQEAAR